MSLPASPGTTHGGEEREEGRVPHGGGTCAPAQARDGSGWEEQNPPWEESYTTGQATLYLGDCLPALRWMVAAGVRGHVICDPPYEKALHDAKAHTKQLRKDGGKSFEEIDFAPIDEIRAEFVELVGQVCGGWFIAFCTLEGIRPWADAINSSIIRYKKACIWNKLDAAPQMNGQGPATGAEGFVVAWNGKGVARWNGGGKRGVYDFKTGGPERDGRHPTEKPRRLMSALVADFTQPGDLIIDPFMGGGTTGVAALYAGRRFIGVELQRKYFEVARRRVGTQAAQDDLFPQAKES